MAGAAAAKDACSLLTRAEVEAALTVGAGDPTRGDSEPKQFASGGTGTIDNCRYGGPGTTGVDVALVTAKDAADAQAEFEAATGLATGDTLLHDNIAYVIRGNRFATFTVNVDFDAEAPAGVDVLKRDQTDAYMQSVVLSLVSDARARL